ncbi:nuclear transport factor 2 family protein [Eisenibacter elegans]|uniref:nuclear transport factor 2 family protein n=1 Tax=Eisenibacter elegans TaxID=997 RepID=UPI0003F6645F|nr:nuclear transport factor 2 family protein [Eisenibacter elegans]
MHPNEQKIKDFYHHLQQRDAQQMANLYTDNAYFKDAIFELRGAELKAMWQMLCKNATADFVVTCQNIHATDTEGSAEWEARYTFSRTGKKVHNRIKARFLFKDGKVYNHIDTFDFWRWARQAFGPMGLLMGWTPAFKNKVKGAVNQGLQKFMAETKA